MKSSGRRTPGQTSVRGTVGLALVLGLGACADTSVRRIPRGQPHPTFSSATALTRSAREAEMNSQWQNKPLADLVAAYGKPRMVMKIPGGGMPPSFAVVYGHDPDSGCIDAFAVSTGEPVVRIYHCR
jgi:hypothetical protein